LIAAPNLLDLLWPIFLLLGWEEVRIDPGNTPFTPLDFVSYPYSHGLLGGWICIPWRGWFDRRRSVGSPSDPKKLFSS
jgi:hypothetical protein